MTTKQTFFTPRQRVFPGGVPHPNPETDIPDWVLGQFRKEGLANYPLQGKWYERWADGTEWPLDGTFFVGNWDWRNIPAGTFTATDPTAANCVYSTEDIMIVPANAEITSVQFTSGNRYVKPDETVVMVLIIDPLTTKLIDVIPGAATFSGYANLSIQINRAYPMDVTVGIYTPGGVAHVGDRDNGNVFGIAINKIAVDSSLAVTGQVAIVSDGRPAIGIEYLTERPHTDSITRVRPIDRGALRNRFPMAKTLIGHASEKGLVYRQAFDNSTGLMNSETVVIASGVDLLLQSQGTIMHPDAGNVEVSSVVGLVRHLDGKIAIIPPTKYFENCRFCVVLEWIEAVPTF
jgi:hypothetical protein